LWRDALDAEPWDGPALWLHGDLHPFNIVLSADQARVGAPDRAREHSADRASADVSGHAPVTLRAVVDFGDMTAGDPACDLATAWLTFDALGRAHFRDRVTAACGTDDATWRRARGWALGMATSLRANSDDNPPFAALGETVLKEIREDFLSA
jgi:aminoglycoside phosphotransferase (APT) family kinase protein